jgi:hypothetical protein
LFNIKWGIISGAAAFVLSLLVGSLSHVALGYLFVRATIFAVLFFALGLGLHIVINSYLPDLLIAGQSDEYGPDTLRVSETPGSRINITLGEAGGAVPEMYRHGDNSEEVGNIADLLAGGTAGSAAEAGPARNTAANGMDQTPQNGYTKSEEVAPAFFGPANPAESDRRGSAPEEFQSAPAYSGPVFTASVSAGEDLGGLPDLDAMAGAFLSGGEDSTGEFASGGEQAPLGERAAFETPKPARPSGGKKPEGFEGDFNPKELAEGIRTILTKERQG